VNCLRDKPMTQLSIRWILSLNRLSQKWGQVQYGTSICAGGAGKPRSKESSSQ
jgi:hypothetical protein